MEAPAEADEGEGSGITADFIVVDCGRGDRFRAGFDGEWKASLSDLERRLPGLPSQGTAVDNWRCDAESLRSSIASTTASNAESKLPLPDPLPIQPSHSQMEQKLRTLSAAADYLPGVSIQHLSANGNEAGIMVRGFSTRGEVPLYVDGIPISVPYDGYVDFNRFLTSEIAELQVAKGYSSPLLGPSALGGTINLVTQEPTKKIDLDALIGTGSGNTLLSALQLGSRWRRFFFQGSIDWLQDDFIPLSGNFPVLHNTGTFLTLS
jgi:hypothetical protein